MVFKLKYNTSTIGANIDAVIQKDGDSGLGDVWSETLDQWTTLAANYADRTMTVTEQPEGSATGYASVIDFDTTYTGALVVGYFDGALADPAAPGYVANTKPLFSEVRYVRRGEEFDFVVAEDRTNQDISRIFCFKLSKRTDGTYAAKDSIAISDSDDFDFTFNLPDLLPSNVAVAQIQEITVTPSGSLTVEKVGPQGAYPILSLGGGQTTGTTYTVSCVCIMDTGDQLKCEGTFTCVS